MTASTLELAHESIESRVEKALIIPSAMQPSQHRHITEIIASHSKRLMGFIRGRVSSEEDAEDILQDTFYQLTQSVLSTGPVEQLTSWLFTVVRNRITDRHRKKRETSIESLAGDESDTGLNIDEFLSDADNTPETAYLRTLFWKTLEDALDELPQAQKDVFMMHEIEGLSFNEIAEITGTGVPTLISRKRYAVIHLRERLSLLRAELLS